MMSSLVLVNLNWLFCIGVVCILWRSFAGAISDASCLSSCGDDMKKKVDNNKSLSLWLAVFFIATSVGLLAYLVYSSRRSSVGDQLGAGSDGL